MSVDIPNYTAESPDLVNDQGAVVIENGAYVIPVVWNRRILVFFPQFIKKSLPPQNIGNKSMQDIGNENPAKNSSAIQYWEVKLCFSERRDGVWTQKTVSSDGVYEN